MLAMKPSAPTAFSSEYNAADHARSKHGSGCAGKTLDEAETDKRRQAGGEHAGERDNRIGNQRPDQKRALVDTCPKLTERQQSDASACHKRCQHELGHCLAAAQRFGKRRNGRQDKVGSRKAQDRAHHNEGERNSGRCVLRVRHEAGFSIGRPPMPEMLQNVDRELRRV